MAILNESPWYQEILRLGRQQEAVAMITRQLTLRLGLLSPKFQEQVNSLSLEQLEDLSEVLLDFRAIAELDSWLQDQR